jgi:hypothetical protein
MLQVRTFDEIFFVEWVLYYAVYSIIQNILILILFQYDCSTVHIIWDLFHKDYLIQLALSATNNFKTPKSLIKF